jgi:hypothetical protein
MLEIKQVTLEGKYVLLCPPSINDLEGLSSAEQLCDKCKFNLPAEQLCYIVEGNVKNGKGISKYFSPKGYGMLPEDIVWDFVKRNGKKLDYNICLVINEATEGFKCKDYKFYMYSHRCLLLKGRLEPEMSCAFIVKNGNGIEV